MPALDLNLASRPFKNNTLLWLGHCAGIVLLIAFTFWSARNYREHSRLLDELNDFLGTTENQFQQLELRDQHARRAIAEFDLEALEIQAGKANQVIDWQAFSWTRLFNRMAEVQPNNVKMIAIRPIFRTGRRAVEGELAGEPQPQGVPVLVEGIGRNDEAYYELQDALLASPHFSRVDPERLVRTASGEYLFKLRFLYLPELAPSSDPEAEAAAQVASESKAEPGPGAETAAVGGEPQAGDAGGLDEMLDRKETGEPDGEAVAVDEVGEVGDAWMPDEQRGDQPTGPDDPGDPQQSEEGSSETGGPASPPAEPADEPRPAPGKQREDAS
jgi:hypothetical protein